MLFFTHDKITEKSLGFEAPFSDAKGPIFAVEMCETMKAIYHLTWKIEIDGNIPHTLLPTNGMGFPFRLTT